MKPEEEIKAETAAAAEDPTAESTAPETPAPMPDAAAAERERLKAIDDLRLVGFDDLVADAKYGSRMTVDQLKARVFDAQRDRMASAQANLDHLAAADKAAAAAVSSSVPEIPAEKVAEQANREAGKAAKKLVSP